LYDELIKKHSKIILGGFSQGAMLATEVTLTHPRKPAGLVIMSGTLICADRWAEKLKSCDGIPFIQTHGKNDAILGYNYAENLFNLLTDAGMSGDFVSFNGGHEIPQKTIDRIGQFLGRNLA
jgi:phospholipase/carboxylesterase